MKAVLISIQPKWCELIASGKKTVEVRKTKPKLETPFKCYIYCTDAKGRAFFTKGENGNYAPARMGNRKIIGEFVCDRIYGLKCLPKEYQGKPAGTFEQFICENSCLSFDDIKAYGKGTSIYGWHISDLVIYGKPKELSEFWLYNDELHKRFDNDEDYCAWGNCDTENGSTNDCDGENIMNCYECWQDWSGWCHKVKKPPQSWCYVERSNENGE